MTTLDLTVALYGHQKTLTIDQDSTIQDAVKQILAAHGYEQHEKSAQLFMGDDILDGQTKLKDVPALGEKGFFIDLKFTW